MGIYWVRLFNIDLLDYLNINGLDMDQTKN
jgi:hypothetical protein